MPKETNTRAESSDDSSLDTSSSSSSSEEDSDSVSSNASSVEEPPKKKSKPLVISRPAPVPPADAFTIFSRCLMGTPEDIRATWETLSLLEQQHYSMQARVDKMRYQREMRAYEGGGGEEEEQAPPKKQKKVAKKKKKKTKHKVKHKATSKSTTPAKNKSPCKAEASAASQASKSHQKKKKASPKRAPRKETPASVLSTPSKLPRKTSTGATTKQRASTPTSARKKRNDSATLPVPETVPERFPTPPRRPPFAYLSYWDVMGQNRKNSDWNTVSDEVRAPFIQEYKWSSQAYKKKLAAWKEKVQAVADARGMANVDISPARGKIKNAVWDGEIGKWVKGGNGADDAAPEKKKVGRARKTTVSTTAKRQGAVAETKKGGRTRKTPPVREKKSAPPSPTEYMARYPTRTPGQQAPDPRLAAIHKELKCRVSPVDNNKDWIPVPPPHPCHSYHFFTRSTKGTAEAWSKMSDAEKAPFVEESRRSRVAFQTERTAWRAKATRIAKRLGLKNINLFPRAPKRDEGWDGKTGTWRKISASGKSEDASSNVQASSGRKRGHPSNASKQIAKQRKLDSLVLTQKEPSKRVSAPKKEGRENTNNATKSKLTMKVSDGRHALDEISITSRRSRGSSRVSKQPDRFCDTFMTKEGTAPRFTTTRKGSIATTDNLVSVQRDKAERSSTLGYISFDKRKNAWVPTPLSPLVQNEIDYRTPSPSTKQQVSTETNLPVSQSDKSSNLSAYMQPCGRCRNCRVTASCGVCLSCLTGPESGQCAHQVCLAPVPIGEKTSSSTLLLSLTSKDTAASEKPEARATEARNDDLESLSKCSIENSVVSDVAVVTNDLEGVEIARKVKAAGRSWIGADGDADESISSY